MIEYLYFLLHYRLSRLKIDKVSIEYVCVTIPNKAFIHSDEHKLIASNRYPPSNAKTTLLCILVKILVIHANPAGETFILPKGSPSAASNPAET